MPTPHQPAQPETAPATAHTPQETHAALCLAVYAAAVAKLNKCREACPGVGGDIDASNLSWLIERDRLREINAELVNALKLTAARLETVLRHANTGIDLDWVNRLIETHPDLCAAQRALAKAKA